MSGSRLSPSSLSAADGGTLEAADPDLDNGLDDEQEDDELLNLTQTGAMISVLLCWIALRSLKAAQDVCELSRLANAREHEMLRACLILVCMSLAISGAV